MRLGMVHILSVLASSNFYMIYAVNLRIELKNIAYFLLFSNQNKKKIPFHMLVEYLFKLYLQYYTI